MANDLYDDHYARWSYEQLLIRQPHIEFDGLWKKGMQHFILCKEAETAITVDGKELRSWFDYDCRVITADVEIVLECPEGVERVPERSALDRAVLSGAPRSIRDLVVDFGLFLPPTFPDFKIKTKVGCVSVVTLRALSDNEKAQVQKVWQKLGYVKPITFVVENDQLVESFRFNRDGDIDLIPSRQLGMQSSKALCRLVEYDEQIWMQNREKIFALGNVENSELETQSWLESSVLSCFIDATVFEPDNIRTYLSIYERVYLALPIEQSFSKNCNALGVSETELRELVQMGRVYIVLPQPIDRYPIKWLNDIAESAPQNILLSRRLAALTVCDARRRIPFLYPILSPFEKYLILHVLTKHTKDIFGSEGESFFLAFLKNLGLIWSNYEWSVHSRGAMGTLHIGVGAVSSIIYEQLTGRDLRLELWSAGQKVEWAAALGVYVFPTMMGKYDETQACDLIAGMYSQKFLAPTITSNKSLKVVSDLLAISNSVSVVDFAKEFASPDIRRLRSLMARLTSENPSTESLEEAIKLY